MKTRLTLFLLFALAFCGKTFAQPVSYLWSNGATTPEILVNPTQTTTYYVTITQNGQQYYDSLVVQVDSAGGLFAQDTLFACGPLVSLFAPEAAWQSLVWSNEQTSTSIQVGASGWYYLDATDTSGCTIRDSVYVSLFQVNLGPDLTLCARQSATLTASATGAAGSATGLPANLQQGLVGYWPFNGNANDESGNGNNGTVNGATLTTDRFGNTGKAYYFNGNYQTNISVDLVSQVQGVKTYSLWVKYPIDFINPYSQLITGSGTANDYLSANGNLPFYIQNGMFGRFYDGKTGLMSTMKLNDESWRHIVLVHNYSQMYSQLYIDGVLNGQLSSGNFSNNPLISQFIFGSVHQNTQSNNATVLGSIDDIAIYNRALSAAEVQQLYNANTYAWSTGETTPSINVTPAQTTTYYCTVSNGNQSCTDSVTITVNQPTTGSISASINEGESYNFNGQLLTLAGTYTDTLVNAAGCDSLLTLTLSVNTTPLNCGIEASQSTLCAGQSATLTASASGAAGSATGLPANLQQGLVGYWPFNGNANDESGNGNNGTVNGATLTTDRFGNAGKAYVFDGIDNYIEVPDNSSLDLANQYSFGGWLKLRPNQPSLSSLFSKERGLDLTGYGINISDNLICDIFISTDGADNNCVEWAKPLDVWAHVFSVHDGIKRLFYINGNLISEQQFNLTLDNSSQSLFMGKEFTTPFANSGNRFFSGSLDDIAIYNRALSAAEVKQLYNANTYAWSTGETTPTINVTPAQTTTYYCTVSNGNQSCTDSVTVTVNQPTTGSITASINEGESYNFNGQLLTLAGTYTDTLVNAAGCDSLLTLTLTVNSTPLNCGIQATQTTVCAGQSATLTASASGATGSATGLPANLQQGLVGYWLFNGNANDESGNGNNGTVNGATLTTDRFGNTGKAYGFDGTSSRIDILNFNQNPQKFSVSIWFNATVNGMGGTNEFLHRCQPGDRFNFCWNLSWGLQNGRNYLHTMINSTSGPMINQTGGSLPINNWEMATMTFDGTIKRIYVNGNLIDSLNIGSTSIDYNEKSGIYLGYDSEMDFFNGSLDDIAIYNRALSAAEVKQLYNANTYAWSTGETTPIINVNPSQTTTYYCTVSNGNQSCTDSVTINVNPAANSSTTQIACGSYTWSVNGQTYTDGGTFIFDNGCGKDTLYLTINPVPPQPVLACYQTASFNNQTCSWDVSGTQPEQPTLACYQTANFNNQTCSWDVSGTQPEQPTLACYETATFNNATCSWDVSGTQPEQPTLACYQSANFNNATCSWDVSGTQPEQPTLACYETATFNNQTCSWDVNGAQPEQPTLACYETATFNNQTCSWDVTGTQPELPTLACYQTANFNNATCSWEVSGTQPEQPSLACYQTASFNNQTCSWDVSGTQPEQPTLACYQTANFNNATCSWDVTGTQPEQPTLACYQTANFNNASCSWDVTGTQPEQPTLACYQTANFNNATCSWDVTGTQPEQPTLACYQTANFNNATCSWDVSGTQPEQPTLACYQTASFNNQTCSWDVTGTQPEQPSLACYQTASFNNQTCSWDVSGTQPEQPTLACYETASFNNQTCSWDVSGTQPEQPTLACYQTANFNNATCSWDVSGTQPEQPALACYETATFNNATCSWDVSGTQPEQPTLACYETANFNNTTCSWDVTGTQPEQPTLACYQTANFNNATCSWDVSGTQPEQPTLACYQTANFNNTTCSWDVTGTQPEQPALACYETASFNNQTCSWDVSGTQPEQPTLACYQTANFNNATCSWEVSGTQPEQPTLACYETATFNNQTCSWDVSGTQPEQPTLACYQTANFNNATCSWDVSGTQPEQPTLACYQTANFNNATCSWDVTGTQPEQPTLACYQTASFNNQTCSWDVSGTQPEQPTLACYQTANFNNTTCSWDLSGTQPEQPTLACYQTANFNNATCSWDVSGTQPEQPILACYETANFNNATCSWDVSGTQPEQPTLACYQTATFNNATCSWDVSGTQPEQPTLACYQTANFNNATCSWDVTGTQPEQPTLACYQTANFNNQTCSWDVSGTQPEQPTLACYETATFNNATCSWDVTGTQPEQPTLACYETATFNNATCSWDVSGTQPEQPTLACYQTATFNNATCSWDVTGEQPPSPPVVNCWDEFLFDSIACQWNNIGTLGSADPDTVSACISYTWFGNTYLTSGFYTDTVDCLRRSLQLTISQPSSASIELAGCDSLEWKGQWYFESDTITWTGTNTGGCDSIVTAYLSIGKTVIQNDTITACGSYTWHGFTYNSSGNYIYIGSSPQGCDSVFSLQLTIVPPPSVVITGQASICNGEISDLTATVNPPGLYTYTWLQNGNALVGQSDSLLLASDSADYRVVISNGVCEASSFVFTLSILPTPAVSLYLSGAAAGDSADIAQPSYLVAVSSDTSLSYTWYLNGTDLGVQNDSLMAEGSGTYVVTVTNASCSYSDFVVITGSRSSVANSRIRLQANPNPSRGLYELSVDNLRGTARIEVLDALGKLVYEGELSSQGMKTRQELDIRHVAMGIYTLRLQTKDGPKFIRLKRE